MEIVLKKLSKLILYLSGWQPFEDTEAIRHIKSNKKFILTFSHTSVWDGIIFLLYKFAYPDVFHSTRMVIKPQVYDALPQWTHKILDNIGFIKSTASEKKNGGFVNSTIDLLKSQKSFVLMISPKGKRINAPWRSGYFVIGQALECDYIACGLDYEKKKAIFFNPVSGRDKTREELETILKKQLEEIIPLNTECSEVPLRKHKKQNITIVGISFAILFLMIFMTYISWYYKVLFFGILLLFFILL